MATSKANSLAQTVTGEASRLREFMSGMDTQTWTMDSSSDGWIMEDIVAHLAGSAGNWASTITRAVAGDSGPPEGQSFLPSGERASHPTGPGARASRQQKAAQLLDAFTAGHEHLRTVLFGLNDEDLDKPCFHRRGVLPVRDYIGIQLQELTLHGWDLRSTLDSKAELWEEPLPVMVDMVDRWIRTAFAPGLDLPTPMRYRFDVSSPIPVHRDLVVEGGGHRLEPSSQGNADVTFRCNTGNYILLTFGRLQVDSAIASGRLTAEGSQEQAKNFNDWFRGF